MSLPIHRVSPLTGLLLTAGMTLSIAGGLARAQDALGSGRALDRNPQRGSGGANNAVRDPLADIREANAVVTGNARAGRSFRGNLGYTAADEFRGSLGANDLFSFRRDSSSGGGVFAPQSRALDPVAEFRPRARGSLDLGASTRFGGGRSAATVSESPLGTLNDVAAARNWATYVGRRVDKSGQELAVEASPLRGVVTLPMSEASRLSNDIPLDRYESGIGSGSKTDGRANPRDRRADRPATGEPGEGSRVENSAVEQVDTRQENLASPHQGVLDRFRDAVDGLGVGGKEAGRKDGGKDGRGSDAAPKDGKDAPVPAWRAELDGLRRSLRGDDVDLRRAIEQAAAERARRKEEELKTNEGVAEPTPDQMDGTVRLDESGKVTLDPKVAAALRRMGSRVESLVEPRALNAKGYKDAMAAGQNFLAAGRYYDADDRFSRALAASRGDVMARVGRVHAQTGAGLVVSAASGLRALLTENPELVSTRYTATLLPSAERVAVLKQTLRDRLGENNASVAEDAALLLAYLGFQTRDRETVREGLDQLNTRTNPGDPGRSTLAAMVSVVWLTEEGEPAQPESQTPSGPEDRGGQK
ncbi:MAG: hypothetical protein JNM07_11820 [Phycisphaerae bacterium]|nr:hypothetical protein [Phycisphaerae bacterium]